MTTARLFGPLAPLAILFVGTAIVLPACGTRAAPSATAEHIRGTVKDVSANVLIVATRTGPVGIHLEPGTRFVTIVRSDREQITSGSFLGITSIAQPDGSQRAVEIHVFPEQMRGTGEGSRAWDLPARDGKTSTMTNGTAVSSKMTNGTVSSSKMTNGTVSAQGSGSSLTLRYNDGGSGGSQRITIPDGIPIVALEPGQSADVRVGAHVFVIAHWSPGGTLVADRVMTGKDGLVPPM
jgi:hypothetical protein